MLQYIELLRYRALAELRRDSSGMYLGMIWWVLEPVLYMLVFYIIFGIGLKKGGIDFVFYLEALNKIYFYRREKCGR